MNTNGISSTKRQRERFVAKVRTDVDLVAVSCDSKDL